MDAYYLKGLSVTSGLYITRTHIDAQVQRTQKKKISAKQVILRKLHSRTPIGMEVQSKDHAAIHVKKDQLSG
jgi:hypothetical protein